MASGWASLPNSTQAFAYTQLLLSPLPHHSTTTMSSSPQAPAARLVPGAPPPTNLAKTQKKKHKAGAKKSSDQGDERVNVPDTHTATLIDHAPSEADVKEGSFAHELIVRTESVAPVTPAGVDDPKLSPLVEMLNKRLKATGKKIVGTNISSTSCRISFLWSLNLNLSDENTKLLYHTD